MADADEDVIRIPGPNESVPQVEHDLSDEVQDFRFLNSLSLDSNTNAAVLPRRGEKDFEPNPTLYQSDVLAASRAAMHQALSHPRLHHPRHRVIGVYVSGGFTPPASVLKGSGTGNTSTEAKGPRISPDACVCVSNPKGQVFKAVGQADSWNRIWLLPEEALYLLERGSLEIMWDASEDDPEKTSLRVPMSLQAAYTCLIGRGGLTLERFAVYSGLKRLGYTLVRAPSWDETVADDPSIRGSPDSNSGSRSVGSLANYLIQLFGLDRSRRLARGPLVGLSYPTSYVNVYNRLALIPTEDVDLERPPPRPTDPPFRISYHVYKPSTPYKKSAPGNPDFRIAVVNARTTSVPTLSQLRALLESTPLDPPKGEKMERNVYARLRQGYRSVILAVVDQGVVSYLRVCDAGFSKTPIFAREGPKGSKGGQRGKSKGKNRG
ncbi:hypothetical protein VTN31DRAFT_6502 [Thermomyces dupontii]|uniref:uncharacterized protein n=1 Tax=Talaromyces thermophilus TaxID=28565 RepID=UPI00374287BF